MSSSIRQGEFYPVWPLIDGKPLQFQWGEIRQNQAENKATVRNSFQDIEDGVDSLNAIRAHIGQAFGDIDFETKYRFIYKKDTEEFCAQQNKGTVAVPDWVDVWCIRFSDGQFQVTSEGGIQSDAGFYGAIDNVLDKIAEHGSSAQVSFNKPNELYFNRDQGFYLAPNSQGKPVVNFDFPFGRSQTFSRTGVEWQIQHNFNTSPVMVQVMNDDDRIIIPDQADLSDPNIAYFYFHAVTSGKALIATGGTGAAALVPLDPFYLVVRTDEQTADGRILRPDADLLFDGTKFYVSVNQVTRQASIGLRAATGGDHGLLSGLTAPADDHTQYAHIDGRRAFTGDVRAEGTVTAEAYYLTPGSGGEFTRDGIEVKNSKDQDLFLSLDSGDTAEQASGLSLKDRGTIRWNLIKNSSGNLIFVDAQATTFPFIIEQGAATNTLRLESDNRVSIGQSDLEVNDGSISVGDEVLVGDKVRAEAFYVASGGELSADGLITTEGLIQNNADSTAQLRIDSGATSDQISQIRFETLGSGKWILRSLPITGDFQITSVTGGASPIEIDATALNKSVFIEGTPNAKVSSTVDWQFNQGATIADDLVVGGQVRAEAFYFDSGRDLSIVSRAISLEAPSKTDTVTWFIADKPMVARRLRGFLRASDSGFYPSVDFTVRHGNDPYRGTGSELTTDGYSIGFYPGHPYLDSNRNDVKSFDNPDITDGDYVWVEVTDLGEGDGKEEELHVQLEVEAR